MDPNDGARTRRIGLPYEPLTGLFAPITVQQWLTEIFDYRARQTAARDLTGEHALLA